MLLKLIKVYPQALVTADGGGFIPLHRAIHRKSPDVHVVKVLLDCAPDSVRIKTTNGNLPLHWVVSQDVPSLEAVKLLYSAYPAAVHVNNAKDMTPLDILLESSLNKKASLDYIMKNMQ
jgi:ankyrin repeat protein